MLNFVKEHPIKTTGTAAGIIFASGAIATYMLHPSLVATANSAISNLFATGIAYATACTPLTIGIVIGAVILAIVMLKLISLQNRVAHLESDNDSIKKAIANLMTSSEAGSEYKSLKLRRRINYLSDLINTATNRIEHANRNLQTGVIKLEFLVEKARNIDHAKKPFKTTPFFSNQTTAGDNQV